MSGVGERVIKYLSDQDPPVVIAKFLLVIISILFTSFSYLYRGDIAIMFFSIAIAIICAILLMMNPTSVRFWLWKIGVEAEDPRQEDDVVGQMQKLADDDNLRDSAEEVEWDTQGNRRVKFKD